MSTHKELVVENYNLCIVVTSDAIYEGRKEDLLKPRVNDLISNCEGAILKMYRIVPNREDVIEQCLVEAVKQCDIVVFTGGTGISSKDITIDVIRKHARKELPGFGELFRYLSYRIVGPIAALSRASAFVVEKSIVFVTPGSVNAVELAFKEIICKIARHAVYEVRR